MRRRLVTGGLALLAIAMVVLAIRSWTTNESDRARAAVERFASAVESRDYPEICDRLLARDLLQKLQDVDVPCLQAMKLGFGDVRKPQLTVRNVVVVDDRARAAVHTVAEGQRPSDDILALEKQSGSWRISDLSTGTAAASGGSVPGGDPDGPGRSGGAVPPETVITGPTPVGGTGLSPRTSGLPDDAAIQDKSRKRTPAQARRDARLRALQRRALREQGDRGE